MECCPECGSLRIVKDLKRGEIYCQDCGYVIEEFFIDLGPEWRNFPDSKIPHRSRVGPPSCFAFFDKGSEISSPARDYLGKPPSETWRRKAERLHRLQRVTKIKNTPDRTLLFGLHEINRICFALGLPPQIKERCAFLYREAVRKKLLRGRSIETVVAAIIYAACKEAQIPRTFEKIAEYTGCEVNKVKKAFKKIMKNLSLKLHFQDPLDYLPRFCSRLGLNREVQEKARDLIIKAKEYNLIKGSSPKSIAGAAIYLAAKFFGENITQWDVAKAAEVTEMTIRNNCKKLQKILFSEEGVIIKRGEVIEI